jgi:hypothetical protein
MHGVLMRAVKGYTIVTKFLSVLLMLLSSAALAQPLGGSSSVTSVPANTVTQDTPTTNTVATTDTVMRAADTARKTIVLQVQTASACVAVRFGAAASLTGGSSLLLGLGCSPVQPGAWTFDSGAVDLQAIHAISQSIPATLLVWVN